MNSECCSQSSGGQGSEKTNLKSSQGQTRRCFIVDDSNWDVIDLLGLRRISESTSRATSSLNAHHGVCPLDGQSLVPTGDIYTTWIPHSSIIWPAAPETLGKLQFLAPSRLIVSEDSSTRIRRARKRKQTNTKIQPGQVQRSQLVKQTSHTQRRRRDIKRRTASHASSRNTMSRLRRRDLVDPAMPVGVDAWPLFRGEAAGHWHQSGDDRDLAVVLEFCPVLWTKGEMSQPGSYE